MITIIKNLISQYKLRKNPSQNLAKYLEVITKGSFENFLTVTYNNLTLNHALSFVAISPNQNSINLQNQLSSNEYKVLQQAYRKRVKVEFPYY